MPDQTDWYTQPLAAISTTHVERAEARQSKLTKPPGSLGDLEQLAVRFAGWQSSEKPVLNRIVLRVFAGDHGVTARGVSAFPAEVTQQMVANFIGGGAAISVLARSLGADFRVVNLGMFAPPLDAMGLENLQLAPGTADFTEADAMNEVVLEQCLAAGRDVVDQVDADLFIAGDMGIGNTTSAAALLAAISECSLDDIVGRGTGVDDEGLKRKKQAIQLGLERLGPYTGDWKGLLRGVGGLEIAAMCGAYLRCAQRGIPMLLDGFISGSAALMAQQVQAGVVEWMIAAHSSAEPGHKYMLHKLGLEPLLNLKLRLGEASGAALAVPLLRDSLALHNRMSTFEEAAVSGSV
ncbi:MAG: nicotinate-nucleotide--dimethylbenzimidazole phosphoribosyltransferase [Pseudomonadota bacterium]